MGLPFRTYIDSTQVWACSSCGTHLTDHKSIVSKHFQGHHGQGYLFALAQNLALGKEEPRTLSTGRHIVCDIFCKVCSSAIGWKYIKAYVPNEQYKVGKFLLERARIEKDDGWAEHYRLQQEKEIMA